MLNKTRTIADKKFHPTAAMIKKSRQHLAQYSFVIQPDGDGGFMGFAGELPGVLADGDTLDECVRNLSFALETVITSYLADGQSPPNAARPEKRTEQVNVRFTRTERNLLQKESSKQGFRGIGDFVRAQVIRKVAAGR